MLTWILYGDDEAKKRRMGEKKEKKKKHLLFEEISNHQVFTFC